MFQSPVTSSEYQPLPLEPEDSAEIEELRHAYNSSLEINMEEEVCGHEFTCLFVFCRYFIIYKAEFFPRLHGWPHNVITKNEYLL